MVDVKDYDRMLELLQPRPKLKDIRKHILAVAEVLEHAGYTQLPGELRECVAQLKGFRRRKGKVRR